MPDSGIMARPFPQIVQYPPHTFLYCMHNSKLVPEILASFKKKRKKEKTTQSRSVSEKENLISYYLKKAFSCISTTGGNLYLKIDYSLFKNSFLSVYTTFASP